MKKIINKKAILDCRDCHLCQTRKNVVFGRGVSRSGGYKTLLIGEAPGVSEDVIGEPFVGPSGKLLDSMLEKAGLDDYFITNVVLCRPQDSEGKNRAPTADEVLSCRRNLDAIVDHISPRIIVFIGRVAEKYAGSFYKHCRTITITHPAAILRMGGYASYLYYEMVERLRLLAKEIA